MRITAVPLNQHDLIRRGEVNGFTVTEAFSRPGPIPMHAHAQLSITILLDGAFEERYDPVHKPRSCGPGSVLVRPVGELHSNTLGRDGGRTVSIELEPGRLDLSGRLRRSIEGLSYHRQECFLDAGLAMSRELEIADEAAPLALEALSLELLARLIRAERASVEARPPKWLERAREAIHGHLGDKPMRVSELAAEAGVHPVYFARAFRAAYKVTPGEYMRRLRLERAREQLVSTRLPLADVASKCGFSDQSHFARVFRRQFGITPGAFRRVARG